MELIRRDANMVPGLLGRVNALEASDRAKTAEIVSLAERLRIVEAELLDRQWERAECEPGYRNWDAWHR